MVEVNVNLAGTLGGSAGDGQIDTVIVNGTSGDDTIQAASSGSSASVMGLAALTHVSNLEAIDQLVVDGGAGDDTLLGGAGSQVLHGGDDDDVLAGGDGDDQMFGDAGNDLMLWNPGDDSDLMEGGDGIDTAEVNGGASVTLRGSREGSRPLRSPASRGAAARGPSRRRAGRCPSRFRARRRVAGLRK